MEKTMDMGRNSKFKDGIRIAAGVYLIYLGVEIFRDGVLGKQMQGGMMAVGWICFIGFIAIGAGVAIYSLKDLFKLSAEERQAEETENEDAAQEEGSQPAEENQIEDKAEETGNTDETSGGAADEKAAEAEEKAEEEE